MRPKIACGWLLNFPYLDWEFKWYNPGHLESLVLQSIIYAMLLSDFAKLPTNALLQKYGVDILILSGTATSLLRLLLVQPSPIKDKNSH